MQESAEHREAALIQARSELRGAAGTEQATVSERGSKIRTLEANARQAIGWTDQQTAYTEQRAQSRDFAMTQELSHMEEAATQSVPASGPNRVMEIHVPSDDKTDNKALELADELAKAQHLAHTEAEHRAEMNREAQGRNQEATVLQPRQNASEKNISESTARAEHMREGLEEMGAKHREAKRKLESYITTRLESIALRETRVDTSRPKGNNT